MEIMPFRGSTSKLNQAKRKKSETGQEFLFIIEAFGYNNVKNYEYRNDNALSLFGK